ncbi:cytochrome-c oxidase, cbb3-type subunit III [uncultured Methylibium sp.]|uniref:cytochrome-c oxidase, cbb3-type subunit III n=1 Tax=uncultured Methylibium sp. TaxID=381093 RepID=UPI0025D22BF1|nr:cytochrome-c oxidase, cbb3-type subunit III [uncultured Methylibium sp.]
MSDFFSSGWSLFVAIATIVSMLACLVLLAIAARRKVVLRPDGRPDETTGHTWDGDLSELNNPLPRWWMWLFIVTVVFSFAYLLLYPGAGSHAGQFGWTSTGQYQAEQREAGEALAPIYAQFAQAPAEQLMRDPAAMGIGERLFVNHCAACHGSDARGSKGFPNLTDADWLYGGDLASIEKTIAEGRNGLMPPMAAAVGGAGEVNQLAHYVLSLSGSPHDAIAAAQGKPRFMACAGCHGAGGKGNTALGAPDLTDKVWLHGWGIDAVTAMVVQGRSNRMPAHAERLSPEQIRVLAAYVTSLSRSPAGTAP